jgi:hypothetical protein
MASLPSVPVRDSDGGFDTQRLERIISNYERQTDGIRELQKQAFWASVFQIFFVLADDVLFFVRRSPTIWAFDPVYIGAAVIGVLGARKMIPIYMLSHMVLNVAVTGIILLFAVAQAIFGYDTDDDIVVMFAIRLPLLATVACGVPSYRLYTTVAHFRRTGVGSDPTDSMLETAVGSTVPEQGGRPPTSARVEVQQAGAAALARARSEAGIPRASSSELPGIKPEYL